VHTNDPDPKLLAYQYLQTLPQLAAGQGNTFWVIPSEMTSALKAVTQAFGGGSPGASEEGGSPGGSSGSESPATASPAVAPAGSPPAVTSPATPPVPAVPAVPAVSLTSGPAETPVLPIPASRPTPNGESSAHGAEDPEAD
jgi:hypothetical protein